MRSTHEPPVLKGAPNQYVMLAQVKDPAAVSLVQREVVNRFPNVSSIDLTAIKRTVDRIVGKVSLAIRFMALFSLAVAIPVLFSAVSATRRERIREGVLLKTLGATRGQIARILLAEYSLLGLMGGLTGMLLSLAGGWAVVRYIFKTPFAPAFVPVMGIAAAIVGLTLTLAQELYRSNTTVNCIGPAGLTRITATMPGSGEAFEPNDVPEGEWNPMDPKNSSPVVAWLASDEADYVTGQVIRVIHDKLIWMGGWYERADVSCEGKPWDAEKLGMTMATELFQTRHRGMVFGPAK